MNYVLFKETPLRPWSKILTPLKYMETLLLILFGHSCQTFCLSKEAALSCIPLILSVFAVFFISLQCANIFLQTTSVFSDTTLAIVFFEKAVQNHVFPKKKYCFVLVNTY